MPSFLLILLVGVLRLWSGKGHQKGFFPVILLLLIVEFALICLVFVRIKIHPGTAKSLIFGLTTLFSAFLARAEDPEQLKVLPAVTPASAQLQPWPPAQPSIVLPWRVMPSAHLPDAAGRPRQQMQRGQQ